MEKEKNNSILKNIEGKGFGKTIWSPIGRTCTDKRKSRAVWKEPTAIYH